MPSGIFPRRSRLRHKGPAARERLWHTGLRERGGGGDCWPGAFLGVLLKSHLELLEQVLGGGF